MDWQYPGHSYHNFYNDVHGYDLSAVASQTGGDTGLVTTQLLTGDDVMMSFANGQYPTFGNEHLAPNDWESPPHSAHQAEMAGSLNGVGGLFDSQPPGDTAYASPDAFSMAVEGGQDTLSHALANANTTADGQPPGQRRPRTRPPNPQEWEEHKDTIHSFYMEQNFTLAATMDKMITEHHFHATEKMYKDKFKQWKWSKNLPKSIAARMLHVYIQRWPKPTVFWRNDRMWPIERIKKLLSRHSAEEDSSIQEDSTVPDDFTYGTPPSSSITGNESILENLHRANRDFEMADRATADTAEDLCKRLDEGHCRINSASEAHSRVQEALKASEENKDKEAESALMDAFSYYSHHFSPLHRKTLDTGYLLASYWVKRRQIDDAHYLLDWMTKKYESVRTCSSKVVAHVLRIIAFLHQARKDEEADWLAYQLMKNHQAPEARHFLLQNSSGHCIVSDQMIKDLLALSEPNELTTMLDLLGELSSDSNNHKLLQDLLPQYIQRCDQLGLEQLAIHSRCILAKILAENAQYEEATHIVGESEWLLGQQSPLEPSTLAMTERIAFTFAEVHDFEACFRVLGTVLVNMDFNMANDSRSDYSNALCKFLISTVSRLHDIGPCEHSRAWMNDTYLRIEFMFEEDHECTKKIKEIMEKCDIDRLENDLDMLALDALN